MTVSVANVGHFYSVLRVSEGASLADAQEAYEALERHYAPSIELQGEQGERARAELTAAWYALRQIQSLKTTGTLIVVPDKPAADRARAGCLLPVGIVVLLLAFVWWPRPHPAITAPITATTPEMNRSGETTEQTSPPQAVPGLILEESNSQPAESQPASAATAAVSSSGVSGQAIIDTVEAPIEEAPITDSEPSPTSVPQLKTPIPQANPDPPVTVSTPEVDSTGLVAQDAVTTPPQNVEPDPVTSPPAEASPTPLEPDPAATESIPAPKPSANPVNTSEAVLDSSGSSAESFGLGATQAQVKAVMGTPSSQSDGTWFYGSDYVTFENGHVKSYTNGSGDLKIIVTPKARSSKQSFSVGDSEDVVLSVMGAPSSQSNGTWFYGLDYVTFENGHVKSYTNNSGELRIR